MVHLECSVIVATRHLLTVQRLKSLRFADLAWLSPLLTLKIAKRIINKTGLIHMIESLTPNYKSTCIIITLATDLPT